MSRVRLLLVLGALLGALLALAPGAVAAPLSGSSYDSGDGNQDDGTGLDWQGAYAAGRVKESPDANDDCFVGGVKELNPDAWAFNRSAGGCTPGKSNLRVAYAQPESTPLTTFGHFAFFRNDTTGNTFLTFELNQAATSWTNATGTTIPCRSNGDLLLSYEVGGSSLTTSLYRWTGDGSGPSSCPNGAAGTFAASGVIPGTRFQGTMNSGAAITNRVNPAAYGSSFPANSFGEGAVDLPAVLGAMGQSPCFGFVQMQVHSRSSSSISSAMIDYTTPVPVYLHSCAATGTTYQDTDGDGTRDGGEPGLAGFRSYADLDDDGSFDAGEPSGLSDATGFYRILNVPAGAFKVRQVAQAGYRCSEPSPCSYSRSLLNGGNSEGNDFGNTGPSTASGTAFDDLDGDGVRDGTEPPRAGATYYVDLDGDGGQDAGEPSGTSAADGTWSITGIGSGTYAVRALAESGWTCSAPAGCSFTRTFTSGSASTGLEFGSWKAGSVAGNVFEDLDGDAAARESGEGPLAGRQVFADENGNDVFDLGERQTTTDGAGNYTLGGLAPGALTVRATPASVSWYCSLPGATAAACEYALTVTSGLAATGRDFGHARFASVSGTKFDDVNNSGARDSGEGALAGFTFWVDYDNDNAVDSGEPTGTSDGAGAWSIAGVKAGGWTLREQPNGAYACTKPSPCTYALSLASGGASAGNEFGNYVSRSVSGTVFNDGDADGLDQEAGETGVAGWTVYSDANSNGTFDSGEPSAQSNSLGVYRLTGLANGNYRIRIVAQAGWTCAFPAACQNTGSIGSGQSDTGKNFGVWGPSTISGTLFEDLDGDGAAQEPGEAALAGREVYLDADNDLVKDAGEASATSDGSGAYAIAGVNPGTYTLRQVLPGGWTCTLPSPCSYSVTVSSGNATGRDFGSRTTGSIAGTAYEDLDADGAAQEAGEAGLAGRTVFLDTDDDGTRDGGETATVTDGSGGYSFTGLAPGSYRVRQVLPGGWTESAPGGAHLVTVVSRAAVTGRGFASHTTGSVAGVLFDDADFDGSAYEAGDAFLAGRAVYADLDDDGVKDAAEPDVTTDGGGAYALAGLAPGSYTVRPVTPAGWACAYPGTCAQMITVTSGSATTGRDFGLYLGASVAGTVFEDLDADGAAQEAGEGGLAGQRLYLDANADGTRQVSEPTTLTGSDGTFSFTGVVARSWQLRAELASGWSCDSPSPCRRDLALSSGAAESGQDFGVHARGTIAGHLFTDRDRDGGAQAFGENDQPERTVFLDLNDDGSRNSGEPQTDTDDGGNYSFGSLEPGSYRVRQVLPAGWTCATPSPCYRDVTLGSRGAVTGQDFSSWTTASFSGTYFEDADRDGDFPEPADAGISGRDVFLDTDLDAVKDSGEPTATTAGDGSYSFTGLAPGTYVVRPASPPAGWTCSYPSPCSTSLTLEAGERAQDVHVGTWTTGTVAGTVYRDDDGGGSKNGAEGGLSGWTVFADLDDDGARDTGEPADLTSAGGAYQLTLDPGTYKIREVRPSGWTCSEPTPCTYTETVVSSGATTARNFGNEVASAQVSGEVFDDADADGAARESGEAARSGRTVFSDLDGDGSAGSGEPQTTSAADGTYTLTGLTPDIAHTVRVSEAAARTCSRPGGCAYTFTPTPGQSLTGRDFGSWAPASIAGRWWDDLDGDGQTGESGESGRSGGTLYLDEDADGQRDGGEPATTAAGDGTYSFTGLTPGTHAVRVVIPAGTTCTAPSPCVRTMTLTSGEAAAGRDFATQAAAPPPPPPPPPPDPQPDPEPTVISGLLFEDRDADGQAREPGEPALADWTVYLDEDGDARRDDGEPATRSDAEGGYRFSGRPAGAHVVRIETASEKWVCSLPADCARRVTLAPEGQAEGQDFAAWRKARITGFKFEDGDRDGSEREIGDRPLPGWRVYIDLNRNGRGDDGEPSDVSDEQGRYGLTNIPLGTLLVREAPPLGSAYRCTFPVNTCMATISLNSGDEEKTADFGSVLGIQRASNEAEISAARACQRGRFQVRVRAALARTVELRVDGRRVRGVRRLPGDRYAFRVDARRMRPGVHREVARVTFLDGSVKTVRATFHRCRAARPRYTG